MSAMAVPWVDWRVKVSQAVSRCLLRPFFKHVQVFYVTLFLFRFFLLPLINPEGCPKAIHIAPEDPPVAVAMRH